MLTSDAVVPMLLQVKRAAEKIHLDTPRPAA